MGDFLGNGEMHTEVPRPLLVAVVERRFLVQSCLLRLLELDLGKFEFVGVETAGELMRFAGQTVRLVVLDIEGRAITDLSVVKDHAGIREMFPQAPVAILSDRDDEVTAHEAIQSGFQGFFPTSVSVDVAIAGFRLVLAGGVYCPPLISLRREAAAQGRNQAADAMPQKREGGHAHNGIQHDIDSCPAVSLTPRERGVLEELQLGYSNKVIARNLGLSENTVKMHVQHLMRKLGARTRTEAVFIWRRAIAPSERPSGMLSQ